MNWWRSVTSKRIRLSSISGSSGGRAGISRDTLRAIEQGKGTANTENLFRMLRILGILDGVVAATDPYQTDVGRLRADEVLPRRVRS